MLTYVRGAIAPLVIVSLLLAGSARADVDADLKALLDGVSEIGAPGIPGSISVFGPDAFAVIVAEQRNGVQAPVVAATRYGKGRVLALGHNGYFSKGALAAGDTGRLMINGARWAGGKQSPSVAVIDSEELAVYLRGKGLRAKSTTVAKLGVEDVLFASLHRAKPMDVEVVASRVDGGMGLVTLGIGWGWLQVNEGMTLKDYRPNQLCAPMGLVWTTGMTKKTTKDGYAAGGEISPLTNASWALTASLNRRKKTPKETAQIGASLSLAFDSLPSDDAILMPKLEQMLGERSDAVVPTLKKPVKNTDIVGQMLMARTNRAIIATPVEEIVAHPAGDEFPGAVPADAKTVTREVVVDTSVPRWHSTGLYAAPGARITVDLPKKTEERGLSVRIGAHKDKLWGKDFWSRYPEITRTFPLNRPSTLAANAFGGPVYIEVPKNSKLGKVTVTIAGAVEAPHYVHGATDLKEWRDTIRHYPAPWAEIESNKVIHTVHSSVVHDLDDPKALMDTWDEIMDACADLAAKPRKRESPERYVCDYQISAGYLHAGYPIMGPMNFNAIIVDEPQLREKGNWGLFHEMGHNHQNRDWTYSGTGEVTVNLFSLYLQEEICGMTTQGDRRIGVVARKAKIAKFMEDGEKPPFTYLIMYVQMREEFGWEPFKKVFADYLEMTPDERPRSDDAKRDEWLKRFSNEVGRNLGPFFQTWKVPTSENARATLADLPVWMPKDFPPKK